MRRDWVSLRETTNQGNLGRGLHPEPQDGQSVRPCCGKSEPLGYRRVSSGDEGPPLAFYRFRRAAGCSHSRSMQFHIARGLIRPEPETHL